MLEDPEVVHCRWRNANRDLLRSGWCDACAEDRHEDCVRLVECTCWAYTDAHVVAKWQPSQEVLLMSNVGRENFYTCNACGAVTVTIDTDEGTTPMLTECRAGGCDGLAQSGWYEPKPVGTGPPTWEWVKPNELDLVKASQEQMLHFSLGGLVLRRRGG